MELIRSFIAIELPGELRTALERLQEALSGDMPDAVKWVRPAGIHLTLKFLGGVPADRIGDVIRGMERAAQGIPPFKLETDVTGAFPSLKRPRVVWVGARGDLDILRNLQQRIEGEMSRMGFAEEGRFSPHLTLGRLRPAASAEEVRKVGEAVASSQLAPAYVIPVNAIDLMKSQLTPAGAIYTRLAAVELKS